MIELTGINVVLLAAVAYFAYEFFINGKDISTTFNQVKDWVLGLFAKLKGDKSAVSVERVTEDSKPSIVEIVQRWESLRNTVKSAGLTEAAKELDELWTFLNPNKKDSV